ncbi:porin family protein [Paraflavitalea speifideaquila]|uniref:porin family protein n=1 Tax=Paraflavitalea speifideaquila TaxID=3076558 RepID=UPI0028EC95FC|nr:porin family protein [Paraflavitalea speifideiaquila]
MTKYGIPVVAGILGSFCVQAQVQAGFKAGLNINTVKYREWSPNTASIGFNAGLLVHIPVTPVLFLRPEVQYSVKGYRSPVVGANGNATSRLNYIAVPLLVGFPIGSKMQALIGPEFGYLVKATSKYGDNKADVTNLYQHFDWGLDLGGSYKITTNLGVEARYNYGFRGLVKGITTDVSGNPTGSTRDGANRVFRRGCFICCNSTGALCPKTSLQAHLAPICNYPHKTHLRNSSPKSRP